MFPNIHIDFYYEGTQIQSMICDLNCEIKNSEDRKVDHYEEKSDELNKQKFEIDRESNFAKSKHHIHIFYFNWMELSIINIFNQKFF